MFRKKDKADASAAPKQGFVKRLRARLNQGDSWLTTDLVNLVPGGVIDDDVLEEIETRLLTADVGVETTESIIKDLRKRLARKELKDVNSLVAGLRSALVEVLEPVAVPLSIPDKPRPWVVLMVGVNGAGKTTTLGKLARKLKAEGRSVMLAAGDTFRAAAIEQLEAWGQRNDVPVISQPTGADPAAVLFDAYRAASARGIDVLLADTAGRLHSQKGLMDELAKIKRVLERAAPGAPHEIMLVLDAGLGQNALAQAEQFHAELGLTGITITKLDGTAKGGIVLAIANRLGLPIRFIGIGEQLDDMQPFDATAFTDALLEGRA